MKASLILLSCLLAVSVAARAAAGDPASEIDEDGLVSVKVKGLEHVYAQPGANLSEYTKVMLDPVEVSFSKSWKPDRTGGPITAAEQQTIKNGLARIFRDEFAHQLRAGGYPLVTTAGADVLRVRAEIRDLYINAPDLPRAGPTRVYALSTGEMRLVAELRDAPSGALIARVFDYKRDPDKPWLHFTSRVENEAAARRAIGEWAGTLRRQLDAAHSLKQ